MIGTVAGTGSDGYWGDGGLATVARVNKPWGVSVAPSGNIYIADTDNHVIRKVDGATGIISTFAGTGSSGYWGDGGSAALAWLKKPGDVFATPSEVYIADTENSVVRKVWWSGVQYTIATVAGTGSSGYSGDGGSATSAKLNKPCGLYVDGAGNIYIADTDNSVIRKVWWSGVQWTIATVAGTGSSGYSGNGGPATSAKLDKPEDVYLDVSGNIYIADTGNHVIRRVAAGTGIITTVAGTGSSGNSRETAAWP